MPVATRAKDWQTSQHRQRRRQPVAFLRPLRSAPLIRLLFLMLCALPAFAQYPAAQRPWVIAQPFLADTLDPIAGNTGWALQSHGVAETLFTVGRRGEVEPNLATAAVQDGGGWRVTLLPGLRFSDGSVADEAAVARSLLRALTTTRAPRGAWAPPPLRWSTPQPC